MPKFFDSIPDDLRDWALEQQLFFVASAPLAGRHINVSPKGLPASTFTIFDGNHAAYVDAAGSGAETISHVYENGRVTVMFCSFDKNPRIMRFFCTGRVVEYTDPEFQPLLKRMHKSEFAGARAVILLDVFKVQTACGYAVPLLSDEKVADSLIDEQPRLEDRDTLTLWASGQVKKGTMQAYQAKNNARSLDGLGGLKAARRIKGETMWAEDLEIWIRRVVRQWDALVVGALIALIAMRLINVFLPAQISQALHGFRAA